MEHIHAQIAEDAYEIDAAAIAEAIIRRLLEGRSISRPDPGTQQH